MCIGNRVFGLIFSVNSLYHANNLGPGCWICVISFLLEALQVQILWIVDLYLIQLIFKNTYIAQTSSHNDHRIAMYLQTPPFLHLLIAPYNIDPLHCNSHWVWAETWKYMHTESTPILGDTLRNMYHTCQNCRVFFYLVQHLIHNRKVAKIFFLLFYKDLWIIGKKGFSICFRALVL